MAIQGKRAALTAIAAAAMGIGFGGVSLATDATPTPKPSAVNNEPESTTAQYGDWVLQCARLQTGGRFCEVRQTIEVKDKGAIAQVVVGRTDAKSPTSVTVVLPTNISLPSVVLLSIDDKDDQAAELAWKQCVPGGCFAWAEVKKETLERWRGQSGTGIIRFLNSAKQPLSLSFSFRGFANALDNLGKSVVAQ